MFDVFYVPIDRNARYFSMTHAHRRRYIMMEACSAVLFDQRDDPRGEREQIYTSLDIRRATKLCNQINESRIKRAKKKRELNTQEIMREKQRMKRELLEKQKAKYEERLAKERARLIEIAKREEEEKQRVLRLKREREEEERVRAAKHRAMLDMENAHIREIMDQMSEEEIEQREAMEKLKKLENERIGKIKADEREKSMANARREAQKLAQDQKVLDLQEKKEGVVDGSQGTDEVNGQTSLDLKLRKQMEAKRM